MKKNVLFLSIILLTLAVCFMGCTRIEPGHVGIKVVYGGGDRGVQDFPLVTGWVFYMPGFSTVYEYPTFVQTAIWTASLHEGAPTNEEISFNTKEGLVVSGDISLAYQLVPDSVPKFYVKFRSDKLKTFTHGFLRNIARDAFNEVGSKYVVEDIYGAKKENFLKEVKNSVNQQVAPYGVTIEQFGFVGALRIPAAVKGALDAKIQATQDAIKAENQVRQAKAEAQKVIATAEGAARANALLNRSITPTLIEWERLQIARLTIEKWNGQRPTYEGVGANLMFAVPGK
jgi:regulator of protease activity HflC (stomatin/prohibitin superfamily)